MSWIDELNQGTYGVSKTTPGNGISIDQLNAYMASQKPTKTTKEKNWLLDQLSTAGGVGGSLGGAALGTAILPGIGTLIGGALGGALGSGAGEMGENVISGEQDAWKNVGQEALLGGVTGVPIFGAAKGIAGAGKALLSGAGKTAANEALATALKVGAGSVAKGAAKGAASSLAASTGKGLVTDVLGVKTGAKLAGKGILKPQYIDDLGNFVMKQTKGSAFPSAADVLIKTQNYADDIGKQISKKITNSNIAVNGASLSGDIVKNLQKGLLSTDDDLVKGVLDRLKTAKSPTDVWELRKVIDDKISWIANPDAATSNMNAIAHNIRDTLSNTLNKVGVKDLNKEYAMAQDAIKLLQKPALSPKGINIAGMNIGGEIAQKGQIAAGRALGSAESAMGSLTSKIPQGLVGTTARQAGGRAIMGVDQGDPTTLENAMMQTQGQTYQPSQTAQTTQQQTQSPFGYSADQIGQALMLAYSAGDKASSTQLQQMYELAKSYETSAPKYSSTVATALTDVQSSLSELNKLSSAIQSGNGEVSPIVGTLRSLNPYDVDQKTLLAMIDKTRQIVGKALEGGVLRKEDEAKYRKILPTTSDTKEVALNKIAMIREQLQERMSNYSGLVGAGSQTDDLTSALLQAQGSY